MHVQSVHTEVKSRQVHTLEYLHERLTFPSLHMHDLPRILLHGSFDKAQKVLLVHAGGGVDMCVNLRQAHKQEADSHNGQKIRIWRR